MRWNRKEGCKKDRLGNPVIGIELGLFGYAPIFIYNSGAYPNEGSLLFCDRCGLVMKVIYWTERDYIVPGVKRQPAHHVMVNLGFACPNLHVLWNPGIRERLRENQGRIRPLEPEPSKRRKRVYVRKRKQEPATSPGPPAP